MKVAKLVEILLKLPQGAIIKQYEFEYGLHDMNLIKVANQSPFKQWDDCEGVDYLVIQVSGDSVALDLERLLLTGEQHNESS